MEWMLIAMVAGGIWIVVRNLDEIRIKFKNDDPPKPKKRIKNVRKLLK
jgi:hypothetical protein